MGVSQAAFADPKKPQARGGAKKPTGAKKGGKPKKPKEPGYKPDLEVAMKALDGKIKVRDNCGYHLTIPAAHIRQVRSGGPDSAG